MLARKFITLLTGGARVPAWVLPGAKVGADFTAGLGYPTAIATMLACTRTASAYGQTSAGALTLFGTDTLRITDRGLLVEEARTNLVLSSGDLTNVTYWTLSNAISTGGQADLAGGTAATTWNEQNNTSQHFLIGAAGGAIAYANGSTYTLSTYVKAGTGSIFQLTFPSAPFTGLGYANFDLVAGTVAATGGTLVGSGIQNLGNGWFRCYIIATCNAAVGAAGTPLVGGILTTASTRLPSYTATSRTLTFAFPQVELGAFPTSYIPTTTASATRQADNISLIGAASTRALAAQGWGVVETGVGNFTASAFLLGGSGASDYYVRQGSGGATTIQGRLGGAGAGTATIGGAASIATNAVKSGVTWDSAVGFDLAANNGTPASVSQSLVLPAGVFLGGRSGSSMSSLLITKLWLGSGYLGAAGIAAKTV